MFHFDIAVLYLSISILFGWIGNIVDYLNVKPGSKLNPGVNLLFGLAWPIILFFALLATSFYILSLSLKIFDKSSKRVADLLRSKFKDN